jgi:predicted DNA binding protein
MAASLRRYLLPKDLPNALKRLDDGELASLLGAALDEAKRRGKLASSLAASDDPTPRSRKRNESSKVRPAHVAVLSLTTGQVKAVRAAFKAGIAPPRIAREFGISPSEVRKVLASDARQRGRER